MSFMRVWLLLALLLAGAAMATAQTGGLSDILTPGQSEQKTDEQADKQKTEQPEQSGAATC